MTLDAYLFPARSFPKPSDQAFVDLYCGPGGFGTGVEDYFTNAAAVDSEADPCATYRINHRKTRVYQMKVGNFLRGCIPKDFEGVTINAEGVIGGPPCQGFSDLNKNASAEQQSFSERVRQLRVMANGIRILKPMWAVIENVASVPRAMKIRTVAALKHLGYKVVSKTIYCGDYGSVQIRRRWIIIAHRHHHVFPAPAPVTRRAADILDPSPGPSEIGARPGTLAAIQHLPPGRWVALPGQRFKVYYVIEPGKLLPAVVNPT